MYGIQPGDELFELVLHADAEVCREFPAELFCDPDLIWHQQHLGLPGHVAVAGLMVRGRRLYTTARFSDVVQRISRRRDLKTRIENVFRGWDHMLLNGIVHFAHERGLAEICLPTAELARENTDRRRNPQPMLFDRVYDGHLAPFRPRREERWWVLDVATAAARRVPPRRRETRTEWPPTVCLCHDTERGLGYRGIDETFADEADRFAPEMLERMLEIEQRAGVRATYSVPGCLLPDIRAPIEAGGHDLAFHSYDHSFAGDQLHLCRKVDYRIPGYRPPQSKIGADLGDERLAFHNFEWLASGWRSLGVEGPTVIGGIVRLPILTDDHPLHTAAIEYDSWSRRILDRVARQGFSAIGLHDCYAPHWLGRFESFLDELCARAELRRMTDVANDLIRATAM